MDFEQLYDLLKSAKIPIKKSNSRVKLPLPFMVASKGRSVYRGSDNEILLKEYSPQIEIYTKEKDDNTHKIIENILINNNIPFEVSEETLIADEGIFVRYYDLEKIIYKLQEAN